MYGHTTILHERSKHHIWKKNLSHIMYRAHGAFQAPPGRKKSLSHTRSGHMVQTIQPTHGPYKAVEPYKADCYKADGI